MGQVLKEKSFKYLGIYIDAKGSIEQQLKHVKTAINQMAYQLRPLNKLVPLSHVTQMWKTYLRPLFQYSQVLQNKWEKLRRFSMKMILGLPKSLSARRMKKIWKKFDFRTPFANFLKQYQLQIREGEPFKIFINQQYQNFQEIERKRKRIQYFPDKGYFEKFKFNWMKYGRMKIYDTMLLLSEYEALDRYIDKRAELEDAKIDVQNQRVLCHKLEKLNEQFRKQIELNGDFKKLK